MNKDLFIYIFNNKILNQKIFNYVYLINRIIDGNESKRWNDLNESPITLVSYGYLDLLKLYQKRNPTLKYDSFLFKRLLTKAVAKRHLPVLKYLVDELNMFSRPFIGNQMYDCKLLGVAVEVADFAIIEYLESMNDIAHWDYPEVFIMSPISRSLGIVKHFSDRLDTVFGGGRTTVVVPSRMKVVFEIAASIGIMEIIEWLIANRSEWRKGSNMYIHAVSGNKLHVLEFLQRESLEKLKLNTNLFELASKNLEMVKWFCNNLHQQQQQDTFTIKLDSAAKHSLSIVKWLNENTTPACTVNAMDLAASNGLLDVVEYLHQVRTEGCTVKAMNYAASNGFLPVVRFLHENRSEGCTTLAIDGASRFGSLEIVRFLTENRSEGCTQQAMSYAASNGHLDVLIYLHQHRTEGCSTDAMDRACYNKRINIVKWLHANRSEGCSTDAMDEAANQGSLELVQFLHENRSEGCTTLCMDNAASSGHFEIVQWLHNNRTEGATTKAIDDAAGFGRLDIVEWLHNNRTEGASTLAMDKAAVHGHFNCVKWLNENRTEGFSGQHIISQAQAFGYQKIADYLLNM
ncbi:hypothetical protein PPL_08663 [Heterostelium album PN500]|uniref:Ankyrin repeat protein n=1 Tax=Heterostelium pallidum (strain ATCC 26659 / Pp 5 / PN500) TaxID=670386 RepID=D3BJD8_HETP5|nr:hypothetical protein PPL_08663 [Heterostelium album PN500]EFA78018.1 hypothetical protein PPL_08663 [Heterostelium album PN500]|eukprot:XP_020430146.1 hypothetical protein PPL_08663 [Heterostelium album PN500]